MKVITVEQDGQKRLAVLQTVDGEPTVRLIEAVIGEDARVEFFIEGYAPDPTA
jgi:hypothetical protein